MPTKIYISGPISGTNDYMERFASMETRLQELGYVVINPAKECAHLPDSTTWKEYMSECLKMLLLCDAICMLKGWSNSKGAKIELDVASKCDLTVIYEIDMKEGDL